MKKTIRQLFNRVENGDVIGKDKIIYNNISDKKSKVFLDEIFYLIILNLKRRISLHETAYKKIIDLNLSGNPFWLDETDFVIEFLHNEGQIIDKKIEKQLVALEDISPKLSAMINEIIQHDRSVRSCLGSWLVVPERQLYEQTGKTFPNIYFVSIESMKDNLDFIETQMESFKKQYYEI